MVLLIRSVCDAIRIPFLTVINGCDRAVIPSSFSSSIRRYLQGILRQDWPGSLIPRLLTGYWVLPTHGSPCWITKTHMCMHKHTARDQSNLLVSKWSHLTAWIHGSFYRTLDKFKTSDTVCRFVCPREMAEKARPLSFQQFSFSKVTQTSYKNVQYSIQVHM